MDGFLKMNQYVDWQSLKRTKVEEITPGDLVWWFVDGNLELVVILKIDPIPHSLSPVNIVVLHKQTVGTYRCYALVRVVDNVNLLQVT